MKMQMPLLKKIVTDCFPINVGNNRRSADSGLLNFFSEMPTRLSDLTRSLEDVCKNIEPDFIQIGEALQAIYGDANNLTEKILQSVGRIGSESDEGLLADVKDLVSGSVSEINECREGLSKNLHHVSSIIEQLERLYGSCSTFLRTVRFLKVLGVNIHIESSRSLETLDMFSVVTEEIKEVSEKVGEITQLIRHYTKVEHISLTSLHSEISAGLNQLCGLAKDAEKAVKSSAGKIEKIAVLSSKALEHAVARSKEISSRVSDIVVEIQFHDSMRQRVEHIANALFDVKRLYVDQTTISSDSNSIIKKKWAPVHSIFRLQTAQLNQIISEVDQVYEKSTWAFEKLMNEVGLLSQSLSTLVSNNLENRTDQKGYSQGPLEILQLSLQHLQGIIGQGRSLFERMERVADRASMTTGKLSAQAKKVREIGSDTHILSLNAIIKATHLGKNGNTLQVLSQEITTLSNNSDAFVSTVGELLESITSLSQGLHARTPSDTEGKQLDKTGGCFLDSRIQEITGAYKHIMSDSDKVFNQSKTLSNTILQTKSCLGFLPDLSLALKEHLHRLQEIDQALIQQTGMDLGDVTEASDEIMERYTMQKERNIHEKFFEIKSDIHTKSNEKNNAETDASEEGDDLGDNVELF